MAEMFLLAFVAATLRVWKMRSTTAVSTPMVRIRKICGWAEIESVLKDHVTQEITVL